MIIKKSCVPGNRVKCVIADALAPDSFFDYLRKNGIEVIKTVSINNNLNPVSTHPDMQICHLGGSQYVCEPTIYEYYKNSLNLYGVNLTKGSTAIKSNYPFDIAYNVVITGNFLLHNLKYTDRKIFDFALSNGMGIYNTKQGYTKCATCIIDDNAVITADEGIYKACISTGIDCLLIERDTILLGDRTDGFIGGCCGMIGYKTLLFCGNISSHKSYGKIKKFADKYSVEIKSAYDGPLTDIGSIIPVIQE